MQQENEMTKLERLKKEARKAATWRGHTLKRFELLNSHAAVADCKCGASVYVTDRPRPNECETMGDAVAIGHGDKII